MLVLIDRTFKKDLDKTKDERLKKRVASTIRGIQLALSIRKVKNNRRLKGTANLYRIRIGEYRIGLELVGRKTVMLVPFLHRKEIYSKWPY